MDDVLSVDTLCEFADFISVLCSVLLECVLRAAISNGVAKGYACECGTITESYREGSVIVANASGEFVVGKDIYISNDVSCAEHTITSLQIQDKDVQKHHASAAVEIGIGLSGRGKVGQIIYQLV